MSESDNVIAGVDLSHKTQDAKRAINRSSAARSAKQRQIAFDANPAEFLVSLMQGEIPAGADEPLSLKERADIAKFLTNKLVGNAAQHQAEDVQGRQAGDWVKAIEAQSVQGRLTTGEQLDDDDRGG